MKQLIHLGLLLLASCAPKAYWQGFHGPAYLPAPPRTERIRQLDSAAAANWAPRPALFRP